MKKKIILWVGALVLTMAGLSSCSSDDDESFVRTEEELYTEEHHTDSFNGWAITRDESDRITFVNCFFPGQDSLARLYSCPQSFDEIRYLFPLSEGNEIRLESKGEAQPLEDFPEFGQYFEQYAQYYKGILVQNGGARINYFITPEGKRMTYGMAGPFRDIKDMNTTPHLSEKKAKQVLADYLKVDRDDSWRIDLYIKEFSFRKNGKVFRKQRLVYLVYGPYAPCEPGVVYVRAPQYMAQIDAHTGELISISN